MTNQRSVSETLLDLQGSENNTLQKKDKKQPFSLFKLLVSLKQDL